MLNAVLNWLYPRKCGSCGNLLDIYFDGYLCEGCESIFTAIEKPTCETCGGPLAKDLYCQSCKGQHFFFDKNISLFLYDDAMQEAIHTFKYRKKLSQGTSLSYYGAESAVFDTIEKDFFDFIIPVPIHRNRLIKRGFNQSEIIAKAFSKRLSLPVYASALKRIKDTKPQSKLSLSQRIKNVENIFTFNKKMNISGKNIIITDDIFTTGSTLNSLSKFLKENGAGYIMCITLSKTAKHLNFNDNAV